MKNESNANSRAQRTLLRDCRGQPGLAFRVNQRRRVAHVAIHDGELHGSSLTFSELQFDTLIEKLLRECRAPELLPTVANLLRHEVWSERGNVDRLNGEVQVLRWRIMQLESDAARKVPAYNDATALVPVERRVA